MIKIYHVIVITTVIKVKVTMCDLSDDRSFIPFFNNEEITERGVAIEIIKDFYAKKNKKLQNCDIRGSNVINLKCCFNNCIFRISCSKSVSKKLQTNKFTIDLSKSILTHGIVDKNGTITGLCSGTISVTTVRFLYLFLSYY